MTATLERPAVGYVFTEQDDLAAMLDSLPVGAVIGYDNEDRQERWTKQEDGIWREEDDATRGRADGFMADDEFQVLALPEDTPESVSVPDDAPGPVTVPGSAASVGMLFSLPGSNRQYLLYAIEGVNWRVVTFTGGEPRLDGFSPGLVDQTLTLHPQGPEHRAALLWAQVTAEHTQTRGELANLRANTVPAQRVETFRGRLMDWADRESLDGDFDDLLDEFTDLGFARRPIDYRVEVEVRVRVTKIVSATDEDDACNQAIEECNFVEGNSYGMHGESCEVLDVSADAKEGD